jgi:uncharacterized membrane protein
MSADKGRVHFIKTTVIGGLVFLVPVVVLIVILTKAIGLMMVVAEPMAGFIPVDSVGGVALANIIAVLAIVLACFVAGLVAQATLLKATVEGLETKVLTKVPGYVLIKGMLSGLQEHETDTLHPVMATFGASIRIGLEIDRLDDGRLVVMVPSSPNPWSGPVHIMPSDKVRRLDIPLPQYIENIERFGHGMNDLLAAEPKPIE